MDRQQILEAALGRSVNGTDWRRRMKEGFLVELSIKRWRARKKLALTELGINPPTAEARAVYEQLLTLGSKLLLPQQTLKDLETIERLARAHLREHTFKTPFGTFLPYTSYGLWKSGNEEFKARFFARRDEIVAAYPALIEQVLTEYEQIARHTYQLLLSQIDDLGDSFPDEDAFVAHFRLEIIARNIKSADEFAATFTYDERFSRIQALDSLESEEVEADVVISERAAEIEAAQNRKRQLEEMNRDLVRKAREQKQEMIDNFLSSLLTQIRTLTYDAVTSVLASIQEQETLQGRPVIQLKNLIEQLKTMNFYGDQDIDTILTLLHSIIEMPARERDIPEITRQLRAIATLTRGTILALGDEAPREGKDITPQELGIASYPSDEEIREAREEITMAVTYTSLPDTSREEREERAEQETVRAGAEEMRAERSE